MFFVLSKTLGYLLLPTNFLIAIGFVGAILMVTRFASLGRKLVIAAVLLLVICGLSPLGKALLYPLEARFPPWDAARGAPDGIIVLGGSIEPDRDQEIRRQQQITERLGQDKKQGKPHGQVNPSYAGLTRVSIPLRRGLFEKDGLPDQVRQ